MTISSITALCRHVARFAGKEQIHVLATPVICFEFATISEFAIARVRLMQAIHFEPYYATQPNLVRTIDPATIELDCYGLVFRLTCNQRLMTEAGEVGATQAKFVHTPLPTIPPDFLSGLQKLRKFPGTGY